MQQNKVIVCLFDNLYEAAVEQIKAGAQVNDGSDNRWVLDPLALMVGPIAEVARELVRPHGVVFPEIDTMTKPVVVILARGKGAHASKRFFRDGCVTSVIAEDEGGRGGIQSTIGFGQSNPALGSGTFLQNARLDKKLPSLGRRVVFLAHGVGRGFVAADKLFNRLFHEDNYQLD